MQLTQHELNGHAEFLNDSSFRLKFCPFPTKNGEIPLGLYELPRRSGEAHLYRLSHPLAEAVLAQAKNRDLLPAEILFSYDDHEGKVSILEPFIGKRGWLALSLFSIESLDQAEDHVICAATTEEGQVLDEEAVARLLTLPGRIVGEACNGSEATPLLDSLVQQRQAAIQRNISERNARFFETEAEKLDGWAEDLKVGLEREIKDFDRQIKETRRAATASLTLEETLSGQKQIKALEVQRNQKRRTMFEAQDEIDRHRDELISAIEAKMTVKAECQDIFRLPWRLK